MRAVARALVSRTKSNVEPIYKKQPKLVVGALALVAGVIWLAGQSAGGAGAGPTSEGGRRAPRLGKSATLGCPPAGGASRRTKWRRAGA